MLFLTSDNEFLGIIYSLFRGRQNIFLMIFSIKGVGSRTCQIGLVNHKKIKVTERK